MGKILGGLFCFIIPLSSFARPCVTGDSACLETFSPISDHSFELFRTYALKEKTTEVTHLVIVTHGINRNANEYFAAMAKAAEIAGTLNETLIVAPHFKQPEDKPTKNELFWSAGNWKSGANSSNSSVQISSFIVMDSLIRSILKSSNFPNLKKITITGHSAGGQFVARYAPGTDLDYPNVHYIIANPSSYLYLGPERVSGKDFSVPDSEACSDFNDYPYGLKRSNSYLEGIPLATLVSHIRNRKLSILVGEADTESELLDMSCGANLQGRYRFERGSIYYQYLTKFFSPSHLSLVTVPKVGHSHEQMYQSTQGVRLIFG